MCKRCQALERALKAVYFVHKNGHGYESQAITGSKSSSGFGPDGIEAKVTELYKEALKTKPEEQLSLFGK